MPALNYFNYYTEIEDHFVRRRGKHLTISPLDWSLIGVWQEAGVPLNVVIRAIDLAFDHFDARPVKHRLVNTLSFCHQAVMETYARHKEAYVGAAPGAETSGAESSRATEGATEADREKVIHYLTITIQRLGERLEKAKAEGVSQTIEAFTRVSSRLHEMLAELKDQQLQTIPYESFERDLAVLDKLILQAVQSDVPEETRVAWQKDAKRDLKVYKKNLPKDTYALVLNTYMSKKIHEYFQLPTLSLFLL
ncbi:MAG: hypothetical protein HYR55_04225 [Acidobacteria bacterium]|nr:hypothetical protein [Acidobacteriota bacterium]MBI3656437.1 hypothetical protein [Acidobacteriota bacterium]